METEKTVLRCEGGPALNLLAILGVAFLILSAACAQRGQAESQSGATAIAAAPAPERIAPGNSGIEPSIARGVEVYKSQYCGVCHELSTAGSVGRSGPTHESMGTIASQRILDPSYTGTATTAEEYLRESIVVPTAYLVSGYEQTRYRMPAYTSLNEPELEALVQMLVRED